MKDSKVPGNPKKNGIEPEIQLIVFRLGNEEYGIRIENVKEVTVVSDIAQIPRTPFYIKGVSSVRGEIIAIMDLEARFGLTTTLLEQKGERNYILVVEDPEQSIGILVKEVPHSFSIPVSQIDRTPNVIQEADIAQNYIEGIGKMPSGRLIIILDIRNILSKSELMTINKKP